MHWHIRSGRPIRQPTATSCRADRPWTDKTKPNSTLKTLNRTVSRNSTTILPSKSLRIRHGNRQDILQRVVRVFSPGDKTAQQKDHGRRRNICSCFRGCYPSAAQSLCAPRRLPEPGQTQTGRDKSTTRKPALNRAYLFSFSISAKRMARMWITSTIFCKNARSKRHDRRNSAARYSTTCRYIPGDNGTSSASPSRRLSPAPKAGGEEKSVHDRQPEQCAVVGGKNNQKQPVGYGIQKGQERRQYVILVLVNHNDDDR